MVLAKNLKLNCYEKLLEGYHSGIILSIFSKIISSQSNLIKIILRYLRNFIVHGLKYFKIAKT